MDSDLPSAERNKRKAKAGALNGGIIRASVFRQSENRDRKTGRAASGPGRELITMTDALRSCIVCGGAHEPILRVCDDAGMDEQIRRRRRIGPADGQVSEAATSR